MRRFVLLYALFASLAFTLFALAPAHAADGDLDDTFGTDAEFPGYGFYMNPYGPDLDEHAYVMRAAQDGSLYLFGTIEDSPDTR